MATTAGPQSQSDSLELVLDAGNTKSYNTNNFTVQYIIVAGGGGGGSRHGGGGGAGGLLYGTATLTYGSSYTVVVGAGGAGAAAESASSGVQGSNSTFNGQTAIGGGYGTSSNSVGGGSGGSGGGSRAQPTQYGGGAGTSGQGFDGANGDSRASYSIGGGGGGSAGVGTIGELLGLGGPGTYYGNLFTNLFGENGHFSGGGAGGGSSEGGTGGTGGGGDGYNGGGAGEAGTANTGGGGGGGGHDGSTNYVGGAGGSGIVLIRYPGGPRAIGGATTTGKSGHTVHAFTSTGSFTLYADSAVGDISGNYRYGEFKNNAAYNSAGNGSLYFDGTGDYVLTNYGQGLNPATTPFTVEAWVKSDTTSGNRMWIDVGNNGASDNARFYATLITGGADNVGIQTDGWGVSVPADTNWHYQAIVMDGSTARMYDNGALSDTEPYTSYTIENNFILGGRYDQYSWLGKIANFRVYNKALSAAEVRQNFEAGRNRFGI